MDARNPAWVGPSDDGNESQEELNDALDALDAQLADVEVDVVVTSD